MNEALSERRTGEEMGARRKPMLVESRGVTIRDFVIFQVKLALDGFKDMFIFGLSIGAMVLDLISGRGRRPRLFYSVVRLSAQFDAWLNLHGVSHRMDEPESDDALPPATSGADSLIEEFERLAKRSSPKKPDLD